MTPAEALSYTGRSVLVVGGSSGIGNGIARAFHRQGAEVQVWGTRPSAADYADTPGSALDGLAYRQVDVSDDAAVARAAAETDGLDVLVLAQGAVQYRRAEFQIETFRRVVDVNLNSVMQCCVSFLPQLKARGGSIIVIGSIGAMKSVVGNPGYAASKAGVHALVRTLGDAWGPEGVRVNVIAPGMVETKMTQVTTANPARLQTALDTISLGRLGTPDDMAGAALFLASPLASYITGQTLVVDGGRIL